MPANRRLHAGVPACTSHCRHRRWQTHSIRLPNGRSPAFWDPATARASCPASLGKTLAMTKRAAHGWFGGGIAVAILVCLFVFALTQRQLIARAAISTLAAGFAHVRVGFDRLSIGSDRTDFEGARITSMSGEPIATADRGSVTYDLRDFLSGTRLYGLKSLDLQRPHLTIVRHPDGTYNVPKFNLQSNAKPSTTPLRATIAVSDASIDVVDQGNVDQHQRHLFVRNANVSASLSTNDRSTYAVGLTYGERQDRLDPVRGGGTLDARSGYSIQRWTAARLPIAGAVDFALNSPSLHLAAGELRNLDARLFAYPGDGSKPHLAASATLAAARIAIGGLKKPVENVGGLLDVDENGLLARRLDATIGGVAARVSGGVFGIDHPQIRLAVRGGGDLSQLRSAFAQAASLPMS